MELLLLWLLLQQLLSFVVAGLVSAFVILYLLCSILFRDRDPPSR